MSARTRRSVVWDSHCSFCRRSVTIARALDWLRVHDYVGSAEPGALDDPRITAEDADRAVQLLTPDGRFEGFDAVRRILLRCPPTCWLAPVLWLPPVARLGERVYARIAARRSCSIDGSPG